MFYIFPKKAIRAQLKQKIGTIKKPAIFIKNVLKLIYLFICNSVDNWLYFYIAAYVYQPSCNGQPRSNIPCSLDLPMENVIQGKRSVCVVNNTAYRTILNFNYFI